MNNKVIKWWNARRMRTVRRRRRSLRAVANNASKTIVWRSQTVSTRRTAVVPTVSRTRSARTVSAVPSLATVIRLVAVLLYSLLRQLKLTVDLVMKWSRSRKKRLVQSNMRPGDGPVSVSTGRDRQAVRLMCGWLLGHQENPRLEERRMLAYVVHLI